MRNFWIKGFLSILVLGMCFSAPLQSEARPTDKENSQIFFDHFPVPDPEPPEEEECPPNC